MSTTFRNQVAEVVEPALERAFEIILSGLSEVLDDESVLSESDEAASA
jgi:hypothetical protein